MSKNKVPISLHVKLLIAAAIASVFTALTGLQHVKAAGVKAAGQETTQATPNTPTTTAPTDTTQADKTETSTESTKSTNGNATQTAQVTVPSSDSQQATQQYDSAQTAYTTAADTTQAATSNAQQADQAAAQTTAAANAINATITNKQVPTNEQITAAKDAVSAQTSATNNYINAANAAADKANTYAQQAASYASTVQKANPTNPKQTPVIKATDTTGKDATASSDKDTIDNYQKNVAAYQQDTDSKLSALATQLKNYTDDPNFQQYNQLMNALTTYANDAKALNTTTNTLNQQLSQLGTVTGTDFIDLSKLISDYQAQVNAVNASGTAFNTDARDVNSKVGGYITAVTGIKANAILPLLMSQQSNGKTLAENILAGGEYSPAAVIKDFANLNLTWTTFSKAALTSGNAFNDQVYYWNNFAAGGTANYIQSYNAAIDVNNIADINSYADKINQAYAPLKTSSDSFAAYQAADTQYAQDIRIWNQLTDGNTGSTGLSNDWNSYSGAIDHNEDIQNTIKFITDNVIHVITGNVSALQKGEKLSTIQLSNIIIPGDMGLYYVAKLSISAISNFKIAQLPDTTLTLASSKTANTSIDKYVKPNLTLLNIPTFETAPKLTLIPIQAPIVEMVSSSTGNVINLDNTHFQSAQIDSTVQVNQLNQSITAPIAYNMVPLSETATAILPVIPAVHDFDIQPADNVSLSKETISEQTPDIFVLGMQAAEAKTAGNVENQGTPNTNNVTNGPGTFIKGNMAEQKTFNQAQQLAVKGASYTAPTAVTSISTTPPNAHGVGTQSFADSVSHNHVLSAETKRNLMAETFPQTGETNDHGLLSGIGVALTGFSIMLGQAIRRWTR